jgi:hypothetical protein
VELADVGRRCGPGPAEERHHSPGALAKVDALARLGKRVEWGHSDEAA